MFPTAESWGKRVRRGWGSLRSHIGVVCTVTELRGVPPEILHVVLKVAQQSAYDTGGVVRARIAQVFEFKSW